MFLTNLFKLNRVCTHEKVTPELEKGYCPDCGKFIENEWYITRCACCGVKLKTLAKGNDVRPQYHYCTNCGASEYIIEKLDKINFIDINFAALIKKEVDNVKSSYSSTQCWQEKTVEQPKLLGLFL